MSLRFLKENRTGSTLHLPPGDYPKIRLTDGLILTDEEISLKESHSSAVSLFIQTLLHSTLSREPELSAVIEMKIYAKEYRGQMIQEYIKRQLIKNTHPHALLEVLKNPENDAILIVNEYVDKLRRQIADRRNIQEAS